MNYNDTLNYLYEALPMYQRIGAAAYKANLDNTLALDTYFNHPHQHFKTIHIAGTNGKGSVSHILSSVLQHAGYKTGLYTSPHLVDFRERIKVNGELIDKDYVALFVSKHKPFFEELKPSFFELTVLLALCYFQDQSVDIAIIETGLGGRLDSTNIINPLLSVITNIGLDHTQFLGTTLEQIAGEKAGIIKPNTPVIIGETQEKTKAVFEQIAGTNTAPISFADKSFQISYGMKQMDDSINYKLENNPLNLSEISTDLQGNYQTKNLCTVLQSIAILQPQVEILPEAIKNGIAHVKLTTQMLGKWQILGNNPLCVCDCGHNKEGISEVVLQIKNTAYKKLHLVLGFVNDKKWQDVLDLFPNDAAFYLSPSSVERSVTKDALENELKNKKLSGETFFSVCEAFKKALQNADKQDLIFIGGSTFIVADLLKSEKKRNNFCK